MLLQDAAKTLANSSPSLFAEVRGIAICGVTRTQVMLAQEGRVLRPAITWNDIRAEADIAALQALLPNDHPVVREWMDAWDLPRAEWPHLEQDMVAFTAAFYVFANAPGADADLKLRRACAQLESGFVRAGMRLCDEMA